MTIDFLHYAHNKFSRPTYRRHDCGDSLTPPNMFKPKPDIAIERGVEFLKRGGKPRISEIQRHFGSSIARAERLLYQLEYLGYIGPKKPSQERKVFV